MKTWLAVALLLVTPSIAGAAGADVADAAQKKDLGALRTLVQRKVDVNAAQPDGTTALHWAVVWNNNDAVTLLLRAGADVKARNRYGATPLSEAVTAGGAAMIESLLKAGADPRTLTTADGETVLGVRPEDVSVCPDGTTGQLTGVVELGERIGGDVYLNVRMPEGSTIVISVEASHKISEGESLCMQVVESKLCFFGPDGARLDAGGRDS